MSKETPRVTVAMPTYNSSRTLERALHSIADQDYPNIELIIFDDQSADDSFAISLKFMKSYKDRFQRFVLKENKKNMGAYANLRQHMEASKGKYFVWACPDDYWDPSFISKHAHILEDSPEASAAFCASEYFLDDENRFELRVPPEDVPEKNSQYRTARMCISNEGHCYGFDKNMFFLIMHGLVHTEIFIDALDSQWRGIHSERQVISVWALAGRFRYIDEVLFFKETPVHFLKHSDEKIAAQALNLGKLGDYYERKKSQIAQPIKRYTLRNYFLMWLPGVFESKKVSFVNKCAAILILFRYALYKKLKI